MSYDHGPLQTYEVTWKTGHIETVQGHQVLIESMGFTPTENPCFTIHGMFGTHWRLVLRAPESEVHTIRLVTSAERIEP